MADSSPPPELPEGERRAAEALLTRALGEPAVVQAAQQVWDRAHVFRLHLAPDRAVIKISDSGPGIAPGDMQSVFHPFYSRRGEGGTGLGLSIARELAQALGGRLAVDSQLGKGSTFTLSLPRNRRRRRR